MLTTQFSRRRYFLIFVILSSFKNRVVGCQKKTVIKLKVEIKGKRNNLGNYNPDEFGNVFNLAFWATFKLSPQASRLQIAVFEFIFVCKLFKSDPTHEES